MIRRRAHAAGIKTEIHCHTFRATGVTAYLKNGGRLEGATRTPMPAITQMPLLRPAKGPVLWSFSEFGLPKTTNASRYFRIYAMQPIESMQQTLKSSTVVIEEPAPPPLGQHSQFRKSSPSGLSSQVVFTM